MPKIKVRTKDQKVYEKIVEAYEKTKIIQKQKQLTYGHWDFVVFGQTNDNETVLREGFAEQASIKRVPIYIASLAQPGLTNVNGIPIEEFIEEDIPEKYKGLEIIHVDPLRPLSIKKRDTIPGASRALDQICKDYEDENIAIIHAPHESDWMIAVMKYLSECDRAFPDPVQEAFSQNSALPGDFLSLKNSTPSPDQLN
ncbi:MAG: hypothetical protein HN472_12685 [Nitrospina sp.]|jgi:hypothetical protein|nr:hypothetical protein [Nitrospina sp.]MBT3875852.1 hypothetical protein [Nitrospina sp.]MBT4049299.1 hypothetical protein [Nitrospina sp.]MBT4557267.1 hypothetical protein [Nitrospina sp.]MBT5347539.1 hypothetical protein [Nitrospina sp.]